MSSKILRKVGATVQDFLLGVGTEVQTRGDSDYTVDRAGVIPILANATRLSDLDPLAKYAAVEFSSGIMLYTYVSDSTKPADGTAVIASNTGQGKWEIKAPYATFTNMVTNFTTWGSSATLTGIKVGQFVFATITITTKNAADTEESNTGNTIPEGFRPTATVYSRAWYAENDPSDYFIHLGFSSNGNVSAHPKFNIGMTDSFTCSLMWITAQ